MANGEKTLLTLTFRGVYLHGNLLFWMLLSRTHLISVNSTSKVNDFMRGVCPLLHRSSWLLWKLLEISFFSLFSFSLWLVRSYLMNARVNELFRRHRLYSWSFRNKNLKFLAVLNILATRSVNSNVTVFLCLTLKENLHAMA